MEKTIDFAIIGAAMEVHRELGRGFLELVYQTALALEFQDAIPFKAKLLPVRYKGKLLTCVSGLFFFFRKFSRRDLFLFNFKGHCEADTPMTLSF